METWFSIQELLGFESLPGSDRGIVKKAERENWEKRQRDGVKGRTYEYAFSSLPQETQAEILLKQTTQAPEPAPTGAPKELNYLPEVIWAPFSKATEKQRELAKEKLIALHKVDDLMGLGIGLMDALDKVSTEFGVAKGSLKRWYYQVRSFERSDWLPLLLDRNRNKHSGRKADFTQEAWEAFYADYFRNERPQFGPCYRRLQQAALENGWQIPSASSVKRKISRDVPKLVQVYLRAPALRLVAL